MDLSAKFEFITIFTRDYLPVTRKTTWDDVFSYLDHYEGEHSLSEKLYDEMLFMSKTGRVTPFSWFVLMIELYNLSKETCNDGSRNIEPSKQFK